MKSFSKVLLIANANKLTVDSIVERTVEILRECGIDNIVNFDPECDNALYKNCDLVIAVGGDGTIIRAAKRAALFDKPVLGINAGRIGFLAGLEYDQLDKLFALKTGSYTVESRMMLAVNSCMNECNNVYCLNDVVLSKETPSRLIDVNVCYDNDVVSYRADGIILATPTGSTAYSMSAGGSVVDPTVNCILITPICPYSLSSRPVIINSDKTVQLSTVENSLEKAFLFVDGDLAIEVPNGVKIQVSKADIEAKFIKISDNSFYKLLANKIK
ncbi:MAG: NAD(+)/NADH kinase [bacterium]|nr:NAD(+)/NADH kinase [bacterium]